VNEYILLMHDDVADQAIADDGELWGKYFTSLHQSGQFDGGSSIGRGQCMRKNQASIPALTRVTGFIRVRATSLEDASRFLTGNPVYEAGGTVEIRELPKD
jgi:hypothetical protein